MSATSAFGRLCLWALPLIGLACLLIIVSKPEGSLEHLAIGYIIGTMFGQSTLASAWVALGPFPLMLRLPLSFAWIVTLILALMANILNDNGPYNIVVIMGACLLGQWLAVQLPLWGLALGYRLSLRTCEESSTVADPRDRQFGIRQLMIFTALVGVVFGIGRVVVLYLVPMANFWMAGEILVFVFLAVAAIVITLPLVLVVLLPRLVHALTGTPFVSFLIGLATACELPLLNTLQRSPGPDMLHLVWINTFTTFWILVFGAALRLSGYRLRTPKAATYPPPGAAQL